MAPELIAPEHFGGRFSRTQASDVYAFACVCVEVPASQYFNPARATEAAAMFAVMIGRRPERPYGMPDALWRLVSDCWSQNPRRRPSSTVVAQSMTLPISGRPKTPPSGSASSSVSPVDSHDPLHIDGPKPLAARSPEDSGRENQLQQQQRPGLGEEPTPTGNRMESSGANEALSDTDAVVSEARSEAERLIFPKEDHRLFRECNDVRGYAELLLDALREPFSDEQADIASDLLSKYQLFHQKCTTLQKFIMSRIPWASEGAERSRVGRDSAACAADGIATLEEKLLADLLDANERIMEASTFYDDVEPKRRRELVDTKKAELDVSAVPVEAPEPPQLPLLEQETEKTVESEAQPSVDRVEEPPLPPEGGTFTAVAVSSHEADPDDADDISVNLDEIVQVLDRVGKWWFVQTGDGRSGIVPSSHFTVIDSPAALRHKCRFKAEALYSLDAVDGSEDLSFAAGEILEILDDSKNWWRARKTSGSVGKVPSRYFVALQPLRALSGWRDTGGFPSRKASFWTFAFARGVTSVWLSKRLESHATLFPLNVSRGFLRKEGCLG
ncbi:hypothetical protein FB45DRAFT_179974 [Roridomyces roridus]|uniref:Uncharacterized protein n=1 Tax=Roridomyces roridus TaxID=1738132 RepID=A0AAD7CEC8_9AGAR|nr:hypothetical protein FB45DRAFT_179974 [Roridomyces roridus]